MTETAEYIVSCDAKSKVSRKNHKYLELVYRAQQKRNVKLCFDDPFSFDILDDRIKDLLEIAAYLFSADIKVSQIENDEGCTSSKLFNFYLEVRDVTFWKQSEVKDILNNLLSFLTGNDYRFNFSRLAHQKISYHKRKGLPKEKRLVTFLSGGIDSAVGIIDLLENNPDSKISIVSHQPDLSGTASTQNNLFNIISELYPERCTHIKFHCGLLNNHSFEKNFPTRTLIYNAAAFAVSRLYQLENYNVYENGISAIDFRGINSFDSSTGRSCHPKTLHLLEELFSKISQNKFIINQPFLFKTKAEVICELHSQGRTELLDHTVSCDRQHSIPTSLCHCGICPSCITRRNALFGAVCQHERKDLFYYDLLTETKLTTIQKENFETMIREMLFFFSQNYDAFCRLWKDELISIGEFICNDISYPSVTERIFDLCRRHFQDLKKAINKMRDEYDAPWAVKRRGTFFSLLAESRNYMLEMRSNGISEPEAESKYSSALTHSPLLDYVPPKKLKETVAEHCYDLIKLNEISTKTSDKELGEKVINALSRNYLLTEANKRSIMDYFRKGVLQIRNQNQTPTVINNNKLNDSLNL